MKLYNVNQNARLIIMIVIITQYCISDTFEMKPYQNTNTHWETQSSANSTIVFQPDFTFHQSEWLSRTIHHSIRHKVQSVHNGDSYRRQRVIEPFCSKGKGAVALAERKSSFSLLMELKIYRSQSVRVSRSRQYGSPSSNG